MSSFIKGVRCLAPLFKIIQEREIMELKIKQREIYGLVKFYPACDISQGLVELLGQKVFTIQNIKKLESIGFKITKVWE